MLSIFKMLKAFKSAKLFGAIALALFVSYPASAQFADSPCDTDYYDGLEARAWLEAQREITQNQNLIVKPDSVLEYTCFDGHLAELGDHADEMFSETTRWGTILPSTSMDTALDNLAGSAMTSYINANFEHTFLGGRSSEDFEAVSGSSYNCDRMMAVWQDAKCTNFGDRSHDGFFTLQNYVDDSEDKRQLPESCDKPASQWDDNMEEALNQEPSASERWLEDPVETYYNRLFPTSSSCAGTESIRTGLVVRQSKSDPEYYNEHICVVPGCFWEPSGAGSSPTSPANGGDCAEPS